MFFNNIEFHQIWIPIVFFVEVAGRSRVLPGEPVFEIYETKGQFDGEPTWSQRRPAAVSQLSL